MVANVELFRSRVSALTGIDGLFSGWVDGGWCGGNRGDGWSVVGPATIAGVRDAPWRRPRMRGKAERYRLQAASVPQ